MCDSRLRIGLVVQMATLLATYSFIGCGDVGETPQQTTGAIERVVEVPGGGRMLAASPEVTSKGRDDVPNVIIAEGKLAKPLVSIDEDGSRSVEFIGSYNVVDGIELDGGGAPPSVAMVIGIEDGSEVIYQSGIMTSTRVNDRVDVEATLALRNAKPGKYIARIVCMDVTIDEEEIQIP